jgi:hypothetical protein
MEQAMGNRCRTNGRRAAARLVICLFALGMLYSAGCRSGPRPWPLPRVADPLAVHTAHSSGHTLPDLLAEFPARLSVFECAHKIPIQRATPARPVGRPAWLEIAERQYAEAVELRAAGSPEAVERFYQATLSSWSAWQQPADEPGPPDSRAWQLYHSSLNLLLQTAQDHGRWDARQGLLIQTAAGLEPIPQVHRGFTWPAEDFQQLELVGDYETDELNRVHRRPGLGVPLVVLRKRAREERFYKRVIPFAATVVLRPLSDSGLGTGDGATDGDGPPEGGSTVVAGFQHGFLEFLNPERVEHLVSNGRRWPLANDLSAPFAWSYTQVPRQAWQQFLDRGGTDEAPKLFMLEPHQPGRIPVVFIHGLLSEPITWLPAANELRADPWFREHYEMWGFRYPTGAAFISSAAYLRSELQELTRQIEQDAPDPALSRMVLVGHSMGGLVAKMQITSSGDRLWQAVANVPFSSIVAGEQERMKLRRAFFFEPQPFVERVVFIGTPHGGSSYATRLVGRIASSWVRPTTEEKRRHQELVNNNPDAFAPYIRKRVPTSIDLLEPDSPLLQAVRCLPISPRVRMHSVIGVSRTPLCGEVSDGVVPVSSATQAGVDNELFVDARHEDLHKVPLTIQFLQDTLREHLSSGS